MYKNYSSLYGLCAPTQNAYTNAVKYFGTGQCKDLYRYEHDYKRPPLPENIFDGKDTFPFYTYPQEISQMDFLNYQQPLYYDSTLPSNSECSNRPGSICSKPSTIKEDYTYKMYNPKAPLPKSDSCTSCSLAKSGGTTQSKYGILDPEFNMREVVKNVLLLEDHLFHTDKRCPDCIMKHCLMIEALLDEAMTLDKDMKYTDMLQDKKDRFSSVLATIMDKLKTKKLETQDCCTLAQSLRNIRKPLMPLACGM